MLQRVYLMAVPAAVRDGRPRKGISLPRRFGRDESSGVAGPHNNAGDAPPALTATAGSDGPNARARVEG